MTADDSLERHALIVHICRRLDVIADELHDLAEEYTMNPRRGEPLLHAKIREAERAAVAVWHLANDYLHPPTSSRDLPQEGP